MFQCWGLERETRKARVNRHPQEVRVRDNRTPEGSNTGGNTHGGDARVCWHAQDTLHKRLWFYQSEEDGGCGKMRQHYNLACHKAVRGLNSM